jgi:hypothetical protein
VPQLSFDFDCLRFHYNYYSFDFFFVRGGGQGGGAWEGGLSSIHKNIDIVFNLKEY